MPAENRIGRIIKVIREAKGLTAGELATNAQVSASHMSMIEKGSREPTISTLSAISQALGVPTDVMIAMAQPQGEQVKVQGRASNKMMNALDNLMEAESLLRRTLHADR